MEVYSQAFSHSRIEGCDTRLCLRGVVLQVYARNASAGAPTQTATAGQAALPDDYQAAGTEACTLARTKYDGRAPAWASKLCVTCSS